MTETAAPHRMGVAFTHARRYALFTLVGIAVADLKVHPLPIALRLWQCTRVGAPENEPGVTDQAFYRLCVVPLSFCTKVE